MNSERKLSPVQFDLFELSNRSETNSVALWDVAPRYLFRFGDEQAEKGQKLVERQFSYGGAHYSITVVPARFRDKAGAIVERYPSEREQLVEEVIRQIATLRSRLQLDSGGEEVGVAFTLYEVRRELKRTGHEHSYAEVVEALNVLHQSRIEIIKVDGQGREKVVSGSTFPMVALANRSSEKSATMVSFNWLVSDSIKRLEFRAIDYDLMMRMPNPIVRWLYKRFSHDVFFFGMEGDARSVLATEVFDGCGVARRVRLRDSVKKVSQAFEWLKQERIIESFEADGVFESSKKVDVRFEVVLSGDFVASCRRANQRAMQRRHDFHVVTGEEPKKFVGGTRSRKAAKTVTVPK